MQNDNSIQKVAQSASAIGAAIMGFGIGATWGHIFNSMILIIAIVAGGVLHLSGMYLTQIRNFNKNAVFMSKILWITAWICLLALLFLYIILIVA